LKATNLSPEEKKLLDKQTEERKRLIGLLDGDFLRALCAIRCLCLSDIEVGNKCLPTFSSTVISAVVSESDAFASVAKLKTDSFETLRTLASCVYEIDETHAATLARALSICHKKDMRKKSSVEKGTTASTLSVSALPSPCASAACAIFEMEEYDDCLSGPSFAFLFPILRAALTGPRTAPGCEAALKILDRHTPLIAGDEADASVGPLRREMASAVLELLTHDRSQAFFDPTPYDALISCYITDDDKESSGPVLSSAELAPLLGDNGALGGKNCRIGSMLALGSIASKHPRLVCKNPLIENRIWINCFEKNKAIRSAARKTWMTAFGSELDDADEDAPLPAPSKLYAIPLLPLLNHKDQSIVSAAAVAFATAMGLHPSSVEKSVIRLCSTYIDAFPTVVKEAEPKVQTKKSTIAPVVAPKKTAKKISTGLPTKKPKKSILAGAGLAGSSAGKKKIIKKPMPKAPSKAPTVTKEMLENQFKSGSSKTLDPEKESEEKVSTRLGILSVIASLADPSTNVTLDINAIKILTAFLMAYGLSDGNEKVCGAARNGARDVAATHGSSDAAIAFLIPHFEAVLNTGKADESCLGSLSNVKVPRDVAASDRRKEGAVVALGSVALHLKGEENADKIDSTINMLIDALRTPSEGVQSSVALCLSKLMKKGRTPERVETILADLMKECLQSESLAARRGAAYGISAVVKGSGIASLKKYEVVKQLEEACTNGHSKAKEGALFAIELLCDRLGLLFEPYVIVLLPALLKAFGDGDGYVRAAAANTAGLIMSKLSAHGVKLVMPAVLKAFDEPAWRTKQASIHMLGSMSHCAPKQLASCLPKVVPKLTEAFSDTHPKVKASAEEALDEISKVIRNPEVSQIAQILLKALTDPATGTIKALESLIETEFLHAIDAPSLALIVPVLHRGLRDRAATTKRYGALIAGNMCTMIDDPRDFVPYLPILLPDLKVVLLDPIPDVRSISAKAFGSLTRGLGEATFPDLRPWLIETLMSEDGSSVERSGAAQGLTEVLMASGAGLVENVMHEEILPLRSHPKASTREGVLWVLTFLPSSLGQAFTPLIDSSLPALLGGLSDESEQVRDVAMRAGRVMIRSHGKAHVDKILPSLEEGLIDEDYRIRVASLTLLGDLLSLIGGTKVVKGDGDTQEDVRQAERAQAQIALALGSDTRKRVLSSLYMARSDTAAVVRQSAVQVWKTVVSVTPRTLREILDVLVGQIVTALASGHPEQTQVAGRCLGDIVHKLGDAVLPEIIPVLRDALYRGDEHTRRGVCVGLIEVIGCASKEQIIKFLDILVKAVQDALCDEDEGVRQMAASCFQSLYTVVGNRALDEVVPVLLVAMESSEGDQVARHRALNGLTGILSIRSKELLPYLVPRLLSKPMTKNHADALGSIASVTGGTIHLHFHSIISTLMSELSSFSGQDLDEEEEKREEAIRECARVVCGSVEEIGVNFLISEVASKCSSDKDSMRTEACRMFQVIIEERAEEADFYEQIPIMLRDLIARLNDESSLVLKACNAALKSLTTHVPAEELVNHIEFIRNLIASMVSDARRRKGGVGDGEFLLPGFNMPKGLEPMLPIYQRGILYGNAIIREASAAGLGELINLTASKYLAGPFIIKMTGPLLRIVGDRNPSNVKIAIIQTLGLILTKGGPALRAFVPQFQTTFVKALSDPSRQVRTEAIKALSLLMPLSTRLDPLIKELVAGSLGKGPSAAVETAGAVAVQTATLEALAVVINRGGGKAKLPISIPSALDAGKDMIFHEDDGVREAAAKVIGAACALLGEETTSDVVQELILEKSDTSADRKHGKACCCHRILASEVGKQIDDELLSSMSSLVKRLMKDEKSNVREAACVAVGAVIGSASDTSSCIADVESAILRCMDPKETMEVHRAVAKGLCVAARLKPKIFVSETCLSLMDGALKLAMSGAQRVQLSFNDFLWLAFDAGKGDEGIEAYSGVANFENARTAKTLYSKVLVRIKGVEED